MGYGGSCFPKDVRALERTASQFGYEAELLRAVEAVNNRQKDKAFELLDRHFGTELAASRIAIWGLAFKPNTDDMREASSVTLIRQLLEEGTEVVAHDPEAMEEAARLFAGAAHFALVDDPYAAATGADALVLVTEWKPYWAPDFERLRQVMRQPVLVDGRNIWAPAVVRRRGFTYYAIGRP
jgi:UDPglucose 6-dehydrogenase